jgi:plasmid stabilization system protein ParE
MREVILLSGASDDLLAHYKWLEDRQDGLGDRMDSDFVAAVALLQGQPELGARFVGPFRKWGLRRWDLGIFYVAESSRVIIVAIQHLRQSPRAIRGILSSRRPN